MKIDTEKLEEQGFAVEWEEGYISIEPRYNPSQDWAKVSIAAKGLSDSLQQHCSLSAEKIDELIEELLNKVAEEEIVSAIREALKP
jgi:hypothetical protein